MLGIKLFAYYLFMYDIHNMNESYKKLSDDKQNYLKFEGKELLTWCGGCGNFGIQNAVERALVLEGLTPQKVMFCYDIGCHGNASDKIAHKTGFTLHGLHGRVIPAAAGASLANANMQVIAFAGDGGTMSEGVNHLVHAVRSNYPMMFILHNNENYGLTTGQASSCTRQGTGMNASPDGALLAPMNICDFVMGLNPTFVARSFSGDVKHMTQMMQAGLRHNGFAFIEIFQACPTYNRSTPMDWYLERVSYIERSAQTISEARLLAADLDEKINLGVLYQKEDTNFIEKLSSRRGVDSTLVEEVEKVDISKLMEKYR